jgi:hypothetical protein
MDPLGLAVGVALLLEHFPEKWAPVFRRKCDKIKNLAPFSDSIESEGR